MGSRETLRDLQSFSTLFKKLQGELSGILKKFYFLIIYLEKLGNCGDSRMAHFKLHSFGTVLLRKLNIYFLYKLPKTSSLILRTSDGPRTS